MGGGQVLNAERIENFPGFKGGITGFEYGQLLQEQAEAAGAQFQMAEVTGLRLEDPYRVITTYAILKSLRRLIDLPHPKEPPKERKERGRS